MIFKKMCDAVGTIMHEIHHQKFTQELGEGTLPKEKFIYYLIQDSLYLADFAKALALTAAKLSDNNQIQQFIQFSLEAINAERELHGRYLQENNLLKIATIEQNPACFMYTNYLLKIASLASVAEAAASLLPCFWVYREIGKNISHRQNIKNNPYQDWITFYSSDSFDMSVNVAINITIELGNEASEFIKEKMISAFVKSTQLEWLFWNSAYNQENWLIGDKKNSISELLSSN